jgi:hypothetical protein
VFTIRTVGVANGSAMISAGTPVVVTATAELDPFAGSVTVHVVLGANPPMTCSVGSTPRANVIVSSRPFEHDTVIVTAPRRSTSPSKTLSITNAPVPSTWPTAGLA